MISVINGYLSPAGIGVELLWVWLMLPLPLIIAIFRRNDQHNRSTAIYAAHFRYFTHAKRNQTQSEKSLPAHSKALLWLAWIMFIITLSRPFSLGDAIQLPQPSRDIILAVDLSESMADSDMHIDGQPVTRLQAAIRVLSEFINKRSRDRMGLIFFADTAYLASPLTSDAHSLSDILAQAQTGLIGDATSITDTVALTVKLFSDYEGVLPALVLLTDGENTSGNVSQSEAVKLAASANIQMFAVAIKPDIAISADANTLTAVPPSNMDFLRAIADVSAGQVFYADNVEALNLIYKDLDQQGLNPNSTSTVSPKTYLSLYSFLLSLLCMTLLFIATQRQRALHYVA